MNRARNNGIYAAETILKQRTKDGKVWYLMKWKGYSPRFNTWEPEENVLDDRLLKAYRKRLAESKGKVKRKRAKPVEDEGNPSDEKADVDVEGVETPDVPTTTESKQPHEEDTDEQPADSVKKWRKRRKPNTDTLTETDQKEVPETVTDEPSAFTSGTAETTEINQNNNEISAVTGTTAGSPEHKMTELSVEIPEDEHAMCKSMSTSPADEPVKEEPIDSREQQESPENSTVSCCSNLLVSSETEVPSIIVKTLHPPPVVSPKRISPNNTSVFPPEEPKIDQKNSQLEKKTIVSKSSHFDFLANSIIITDVTTERGTVTVKECSAYGDFFGPDQGSK